MSFHDRWFASRLIINQLRIQGFIPPMLSKVEEESALVNHLRAQLAAVQTAGSEEEVLEWQRRLLLERLTEAAGSVPFYRKSLPRNVDVSWQKVPFLTREILRDRWQELISDRFNGRVCNCKVTSGTSGIPITVLQSEEESYANLHYDVARVVGIAEFAKLSRWESPYIIALTDNPQHPPFSYYNAILDKWCRFEVVDPLVPESVREVLRLIEDLQPALLVSRPSALRLLADSAESEPIHLPMPLGVISSGANLYPDDRKRIIGALSAEVVDLYALTECSGVASQCRPHSRYHVHWDVAMVEVVDPATKEPVEGETVGEIIVTDLSRQAMPIIRYRTGDFGRWATGPCLCGQPGPTLSAIDGRQGCFFPLPDGRLFNPSILNGPLSQLPGLRQYRVIQTREDEVTVEFIAGAAAPTHLSAMITEVVSAVFPCPISICCKSRDVIGSPGVKLERYVSLI